jgi:hypothetical protein
MIPKCFQPIKWRSRSGVRVAVALALGKACCFADNVLTQHNDNFRTGATLHEAVLNSSNVNATQFGKLCTRVVDGDIYAQPLYVEGVDIPNKGRKNVVYVATARNNVYAFDADNYDPNPAAGVLWGPFHLGDPEQGRQDANGVQPPGQACPSAAYYGIISTPAIDPVNNWLYLVAKTIDSAGNPHQMLHRLDIRTGAGANPSPKNTPLEIVYPDVSNPEPVAAYGKFNPGQLNRAGLLLSLGKVYVAFSAHCDFVTGGDAHGWVIAYDARTLTQIGGFNTTPDDRRGGVWQSGNGLAADQRGNVYFHTGNMGNLGEPGHVRVASDFSQSIVRIGADLRGPVVFPPRTEPPPWYLDYHRLDAEDLDITSSGPLLTPESSNGDLIGGGKTGRLYLLDRAAMTLKQTFRGTVNTSGNATPETCTYGPDHYGPGTPSPANHGETLCPHIHSGLVYWHGPEGDIARIYVWGERDYLRAYAYDVRRGLLVSGAGVPFGPGDDLTASDQALRASILAPLRDPNDGSRIMPSPTMSLSANGSNAGTGVLWASMVLRDNAEYKNVWGILRAFDAVTLRELWNSGSDQFAPDFLGKHAKYAPVTIANGAVFAPTFSNRLVVYGPLSRRQPFVAPWQEWVDIGAPQVYPAIIPARSPVTPVARDPQHLDLFLSDVNGAVLNAGWWAEGDQWHDGYPVTDKRFVVPGTRVAVVARKPDIVDLYVVRADGSVWNAAWWSATVNNGRWNAGYPVPGAGPGFAPAGATVTAVARTPDTVDLYLVRTDGSVWNAGWWSATINNGQWNAGYPIPGAGPGFARPGTPVAVVNRTPDDTDLYITRSDGSIWSVGWWSAHANNGQWNVGYPITGAGPGFAPAGAPVAAGARRADIVDLYVVRPDGSVWNAGGWSAQGNNGRWSAGYAIPGAQAGFARPGAWITVINRTSDTTDLYTVRPDGTLWNAGWWDANVNRAQWNRGYRIGIAMTVDPGADVSGLSRARDHVDLFIPGKNGQVFSPWWDASVR